MPSQTLACSRPLRRRLVAPVLFTVLLAGCAQSCQKTSGTRAAKDDLALSPRETDILFMANVAQARGTYLWKKLIEARDKDSEAKGKYDEFVKKCGFDPLQQIDSIFVALPQNTDTTREFALFLRGTFPGQSLIGCLRTTAKESQKDVTESDYNGHKLYTIAGQDGVFTLLDNKIGVLAGKGWINKVVDLHDNRVPGQGAKDHKEIADLMRRARTNDALWGVGLVPPTVTERLKQNPQLGSASTMKSVIGSLALKSGLGLYLTLDLASPQDAGELAKKVNDQLAAARKEPRVQMMGLAHYFDAVKVNAAEAAFSVQVDLNPQQVDDLSTRLSGLMKSFGLGKSLP